MLALSGWLGSGARLVYVARDDARMMAMRDGLSRLAPQVETHLFPAWDCLPFDRLSPQGALVGQRVETLARLAEGSAGAVLLTTVNAVLQRVPPQCYFSERSLVLAAGDSTGPARLCDFLVGQGYLRTDTVRETGEFALRGGILDIYPPGRGAPVRLDFFGNELETIRDVEAATQRSGGQQDRLVLRPVAEFQLDEASIERFRTGYRAAFGAMASRDALYDSVTAGRMYPGV
ncbi:MAG: transcription-repair coupling factor, partial [Pseudomonadota bacterium]|nr:transcription-repair coupling factor [Pseudomonadota bacterium]